MTDRIAINARKAAYIMFEAGLDPESVQNGINTIKQPARGYYYLTDINTYIKESR